MGGEKKRLTNLHDEARMFEWVLVHHDPTNVAKDLINAPEQHGSHEAPGLVSPAKGHLNDAADGVESYECATQAEGGTVAIDTELHGTD